MWALMTAAVWEFTVRSGNLLTGERYQEEEKGKWVYMAYLVAAVTSFVHVVLLFDSFQT